MKRINVLWKVMLLTLAMILLLTTTLPSVSAATENSDTAAEAIVTLQKLRLLDMSYKASDSVSRGQWAHIAARIFYNMDIDTDNTEAFVDVTPETEYAADINKLYLLGIFKGNGDGSFEPEADMTEEQAEIILLRILGYETALNLSPAHMEGYHTVANNLKLYRGVSDGMFLGDRLLVMLYNALNVKVMEQVSWNDGRYSVNPDDTMMNKLLDVYEYVGVVYGVGSASISPATEVGERQVRIGGELFNLDSGADIYDFMQYLGMRVRAYYRDTGNNEPELLFCTEYGNANIKEISLSDLISLEGNTIQYFGVSGRTEQITFDTAAYLVYNNRPADSIPKLGSNGSIRIIRNTRDYDCVIINEYKTYVVDFVSPENQAIVGFSGRVELKDPEDKDTYRIFDAEHNTVDISALSRWDVLTVAASADGDFAEMYLSRKRTTGTISSVNGGEESEYRVRVFDGEYEVTPEFYNENHSTLKAGDNGRIYFDIFGRIAAFDKGETNGPQLGYLIDAKLYSGVFEDEFKVKMLTKSDGIQVYEVKTAGDKLRLNDQSVPVYQFLNDNTRDGIFTRQVIRYTLNGDGKVNAIETVDGMGETGLYEILVGSPAYFRSSQLSFDSYAMGATDTVVFLVPPESDAGNNEAYGASNMNYFSGGTNYSGVKAYGLGKNRLTAAALVWERAGSASGTLSSSTGVGVLLSFHKSWQADANEIRQGMTVLRSGKSRSQIFPDGADLTTTTRDPSTMGTPSEGSIPAHPVERGDVIRYPISSETGETGYIQLLYDRSEHKFLPSSNPLSLNSGGYKVGVGNVVRRDGNVLQLQYLGGETNYFNVSVSSYIVTVTGDAGEGDIRTGSLDDIRTMAAFPDNPSTVFIHANSGAVQTLVIYNE